MFEAKKEFGNANISRTIRFTDELFERLGRVAQEKSISVNLLVLQCCQYALDHMKPDEHQKS